MNNCLYFFRYEVDIRLKSGRVIRLNSCDGDLAYTPVIEDSLTFTFHSLENFVNYIETHEICAHSTSKMFRRVRHAFRRFYDIEDYTFNENDFISADIICQTMLVNEKTRTIHDLICELPAPDFINYCKDHGLNVCPLQ